MSRVCLVLVVMLCARSLAGQTVVRPEPSLDSARVALRDGLLVLRDSLSSIDAAAGRLQRDYRQASGASLLSRARVMHEACARSLRTVPSARRLVVTVDASSKLRMKRRRELLRAMDQLRDALVRCESEFGAMSKPGQGEQVRGYGNDRAVRLTAALRKYEGVVGGFLSAMGIKVNPRGAGSPTLAG
jgi:hypothetical protein